jgi:hypothetical protein
MQNVMFILYKGILLSACKVGHHEFMLSVMTYAFLPVQSFLTFSPFTSTFSSTDQPSRSDFFCSISDFAVFLVNFSVLLVKILTVYLAYIL